MGLSLNDVLDIKHLTRWQWSPDGSEIAFVWDDGGVMDLWLLDPKTGAYRKATNAKQQVNDFSYNKADGRMVLSVDGDIYRLDRRHGLSPALWFEMKEPVNQVTWSPDGTALLFVRAGKMCVYEEEQGVTRELKVPGAVSAGGLDGGAAAHWSKDSSLIAYSFLDEQKHRHIGVCTRDGKLVYRTVDEDASVSPVWIDNNTLYFARMRKRWTAATYYLMELQRAGEACCNGTGVLAGEPEAFYEVPGDGLGALLSVLAVPSPDGQTLIFLLENDDFAHLYAYSRSERSMKQLTSGIHEDFAHAGDSPAWSPDGSLVAFASSMGDLHERHIWLINPATGELRKTENLAGTNSMPKWSPDGKQISFAHCDVYKNIDLWIMPVDRPEEARQLSYGMTPAWTKENISVPEHVTYKGAHDWDIHAFVTKPKHFDPSKKYPALVWVHGGPVRQMRQGFNPLHSYAVFHAYHQYLAHKGYVSISLNYRGGIGYGRKFRMGLYHKMGVDDVVDVVNAGKYLKTLPYVDASRVAIWGISYGGYMTLHSLGQYPDEYAMGVNVAGIWDFAQWTHWVTSKRGTQGGLFVTFFGGFPDESPELYRVGSPYTYGQNIRKPLINLHGTADLNVDFEQLDRIVLDCVKYGKEYEAYYYPNEVHMFRWKSTWLDAFPKIEREFAKRLGDGKAL